MKSMIYFGYSHILKYRKQYFTYILLSLITSLGSVLLPLIEGEIINVFVEEQSLNHIIQLLVVFSVITITVMILNAIINHLYMNVQLNAKNDAIVETIRKFYNISFFKFNEEDSSYINESINSDCNSVISFTLSIYGGLFLNLLSAFWIVLIICMQSMRLFLGIVVLFCLYLFIYWLMKKYYYKYGSMSREGYSKYFSSLFILNDQLKSIKLNELQYFAFNKQHQEYLNYKKSMNGQIMISNINESMTSIINLLANTLIFIYGGYLVIHQQMSLGMLVIISNYFGSLFTSTDYFFNFGSTMQNALAGYDRLRKYLDLEEVVDGVIPIDEMKQIQVDNLSFTYDNNRYFKLNQIFKQNKIYWLKGKNGTGKSTFINLLLGLFGNDYTGNILINGVNLKEINKSQLRKNRIAIVEQNPFIFDIDVKENMLLKCEINKEEYFNELLNGFECRYLLDRDDDVKDNLLSGGEKQKIVIIRALLSDANLLIFDEPTAALDSRSTQYFYEELDRIKQNKIILLITHDDIQTYDECVLLENSYND